MKANYCYITKNYQSPRSAASKAKIDCEDILKHNSFKNIGLPRTIIPNSVISFILTLTGTIIGILRIKKDSTICIQYPLKKYYHFIVIIAKLKKCKIITIIHDLRSSRKRKISIKEEISLFNKNNLIISHNHKMTKWLCDNGLKTQIKNLEIFDYLGSNKQIDRNYPLNKVFEIVYAGVLAQSKNGFIYDLAALDSSNFCFNLYGVGVDKNKLKLNSNLNYRGSFTADKIIDELKGHFGLVWDGDSYNECSGNFGNYLKINNPHKTSLYLRAGLPVIIWDKAALSDFIIKHNIGIAVSSLKELKEKLADIDSEKYYEMQKNSRIIGEKLKNGFYLKKVIKQFI